MRVLLWIFNWKFELKVLLVFSFSDTFRDRKEGNEVTVDMN